jgi:ABC-2 type transport system permease protein
MFVFPVLLMSLMGIVFTGGTSKPKVAVVDRDHSTLSKAVVKAFKGAKLYRLEITSLDKAKSRLKKGKVNAVIIVEKQFGEKIMAKKTALNVSNKANQLELRPSQSPQPPIVSNPEKLPPGTIKLLYDPSDIALSQMVQSSALSVIQEMDSKFNQTPELIKVRSHSVRSQGLRYIDFLVPGIIAMTLMNAALFGLGGTVVNYRERGILRRMKVTPQPLTAFVAAQISNQLLFSIIRAALLVIVGVLFFKVAVLGDYLSLAVIVIAGSLCFITIAFSVASFSKNREIADTLSNIISLPMMFLGGVFFPVDAAPKWVQPVIKAMPLKYLADAMRDIMVKGSSLSSQTGNLLVLLLVTAIFFVASILLWRWE